MARNGLSWAKASALAVITPTITPPIRPGPAGGGDGVEVGEVEPGLGQGVLDQAVDALEMGARGDLRHHAAEAAMLGQLAVDDVGQDPAERSIPVARPAPRRWRRPSRRSSFRCPGRACVSSSRRRPGYARAARMAVPLETRHARQQARPHPGRPGARRAGAAVPALAAPDAIEIVAIKTTGDAIQDRPLSRSRRQGPVRQGDRGGAASAPHRHRRAQHEGHADGAAAGLLIAAFLRARGCTRRADRGRRQAHRRLARTAPSSAPRRCADAPSSCIAGPTCKIVNLRGNVDTRLAKREAGDGRGDRAGAGRVEAAGPRPCRHAGAGGRDAARRRPGRDLHRMPRGRCARRAAGLAAIDHGRPRPA